MILAEQIILLWIATSGLTGTIVSLMISEGKNPLYILANIFTCGFFGALFGGIFVGLTNALQWDMWSLLIPIFVGGIVSFLISAYLKDKIPKPEIKVKPVAFALAVMMILVLSVGSVYPLIFKPSGTANVQNINPNVVIDTGDAKLIAPSSLQNAKYINEYIINGHSIKLQLSHLLSQPYKAGFINIKGYKSYVKFPSVMSDTPQEGNYLGFKFSFSVPSSSPSPWSHPMFYVIVWGDANNDGQYENNTDWVLADYWYKLPTQASNIYTSTPCLYNSTNGQPMFAVMSALPVTFALWTQWKDDSQYTFANTPEGWKPPYDQSSFEVLPNGSVAMKEDISSWVSIGVGKGPYDVYGKLYCPTGMSEYAKTWYITVVAFEPAYSYTEPVAEYSLKFNVQSTQKPIVNVTGSWWIETALFGMLAVATVALVRYGGKWAFK